MELGKLIRSPCSQVSIRKHGRGSNQDVIQGANRMIWLYSMKMCRIEHSLPAYKSEMLLIMPKCSRSAKQRTRADQDDRFLFLTLHGIQAMFLELISRGEMPPGDSSNPSIFQCYWGASPLLKACFPSFRIRCYEHAILMLNMCYTNACMLLKWC